MAWTTPRTWTNVVVSASDLNTDIRDNENILKTRIADNGNPLFASAGGAAKTTNYTVTTADVLVDCGGSSDWTLTLYAVSGNAGRVLFVKNTGTAIVTIDGNSAETIDGAATIAIAPYESVTLWCNGSAWFTVAKDRPRVIQESITSFTTSDSTTNTTYEDMTGFSTSFTPKLDDSTIQVLFDSPTYMTTTQGAIRLVYGAGPTQIAEAGIAAGAPGVGHLCYGTFASPGAGSAITIKVQGKVVSTQTLVLCTNPGGGMPGSMAYMWVREVRS